MNKEFTYQNYIIATIISLFAIGGGYYNYEYGIIKPRLEAYVTNSITLGNSIKNNPDRLKSEKFIDKGLMGSNSDVFIVTYNEHGARTTTRLRSTNKKETFTNIEHFEREGYDYDIVHSQIRNRSVLRGMFHFYVDDVPVTTVTQKEWKDIAVDNWASLSLPVAIAIMSFGAAFIIQSRDNRLNIETLKLKDIMSLVNESVLISETNEKHEIVSINKNFLIKSGYKEHELIGENINILHNDNDFDHEEMMKKIKLGAVWNGIVRNVDNNGNPYFVDKYYKQKEDKKGEIGIRHDITDIINSRHKIDEKNKVLEHANYMLRHDLRSPILILQEYIPKIKKRLNKDLLEENRVSGAFEIVMQSFDQLHTRYVGLYDFTTMIKEVKALRKEMFKIDSIINNFLNKTAYGQYVTVDHLQEVELNDGLFCNAIDNMVRNSVKYNDNTPEIKIEREGDNLTITDNGRGMSKDEFIRFSEPDIRGDNKEDGSGLGLAITKIIIESHGWSLNCEDQEEGTKMVIENIFKNT